MLPFMGITAALLFGPPAAAARADAVSAASECARPLDVAAHDAHYVQRRDGAQTVSIEVVDHQLGARGMTREELRAQVCTCCTRR
jgi:hypothetical protein